MRKLLATMLTLAVALTVVPFFGEIPQAYAETKNILFAVVRWSPLGQDRSGQPLSGRVVPWTSGDISTWWGRQQFPMPSQPRYWSEVYLTVIGAGGQSTEKDKMNCILDSNGNIWFDPDGYFHNAAERARPDPPGQCYDYNFKTDNTPANNTQGPYRVGDYANFFHNKGYWFTPISHQHGPYTFPRNFSGRLFKLGQAALPGNGMALVMSETFLASCDPNTSYNLSVETDMWEGVNPAVTAASIFDPENPTLRRSQRIQKSTVLGPTGLDFQVPATTFFNVKPSYRSYVGIEIFRDSGENNINNPQGQCFAQNLSDDYKALYACEDFIGASNSGVNDSDTGLPLKPFPASFRYYDSGGTGFGCGEPIYDNLNTAQDPFMNDIVNPGDKRMTTVTFSVGGAIVTYEAGSYVSAGDVDNGYIIRPFTNVGWFDANNNNEFEEGEWIYQDNDLSNSVTAGDVRLTVVNKNGNTYQCGTVVAGPELYIRSYPISGITVGRCGNFRFMDMEVLPGVAPVQVNVSRP
ncbi:MAG TPA: hypothetical protein PK717_02525, partial [Caldisericia bacterium]|nr:hypothetical protein [Caldisericia bacterium]